MFIFLKYFSPQIHVGKLTKFLCMALFMHVTFTSAALAKDNSVIDIVVGYTTAAKEDAAKTGSIQDDIAVAFENANKSYENNKIPLTIKLLTSFEVTDYNDAAKPLGTVLDEINGTDGATADPNLQVLTDIRQRFGADVAMLVVYNHDVNPSTPDPSKGPLTDCGVSNQRVEATEAINALSVLFSTCVGSNQYSLAHELGHIIGAGHNPADADEVRYLAYGHGFQHTDPQNSVDDYRTIMSYDCKETECGVIKYWSSATTLYPLAGSQFGLPLGDVTTYDNERVLRDRASIVAGFNVLQTKTMFVTNDTYNGKLGGVEGANAVCQKEADDFDISGDFKAWIANGIEADSPAKTFKQSIIPYVTTGKAKSVIAANWAELITTGTRTKILSSGGEVVDPRDQIWTATLTNGGADTGAYTCDGWTFNGANKSGLIAYYNGPPFSSGTTWSGAGVSLSCSRKLRLYCVEQ